jgi:hypothetical protein
MGGTKQSAAALEDGLPAPHESSIVDAADANAVRASMTGMETNAFYCWRRHFRMEVNDHLLPRQALDKHMRIV